MCLRHASWNTRSPRCERLATGTSTISAYLNDQKLKPLLVIELAYQPDTVVTRPLVDDLRLSREYAARIFFL